MGNHHISIYKAFIHIWYILCFNIYYPLIVPPWWLTTTMHYSLSTNWNFNHHHHHHHHCLTSNHHHNGCTSPVLPIDDRGHSSLLPSWSLQTAGNHSATSHHLSLQDWDGDSFLYMRERSPYLYLYISSEGRWEVSAQAFTGDAFIRWLLRRPVVV